MTSRSPWWSLVRATPAAALALAAVLAPGCARREDRVVHATPPDTSQAVSDETANAADRARAEQLLALARPQLGFWLTRWAQVDSSIGHMDSLELTSVEDVPIGSAIAFHPDSARDRRSLRLFGIRSPNGKRAAIADYYRTARRVGGKLEVGFGEEPDSWAVLVDLGRDSVYTLGRVGTLGMFEEVRWIDDQHLLVTYSGEDPDDASVYVGRVGIFDLGEGIAAWYQLPDVGPDAIDVYRQALDASEQRRLASVAVAGR